MDTVNKNVLIICGASKKVTGKTNHFVRKVLFPSHNPNYIITGENPYSYFNDPCHTRYIVNDNDADTFKKELKLCLGDGIVLDAIIFENCPIFLDIYMIIPTLKALESYVKDGTYLVIGFTLNSPPVNKIDEKQYNGVRFMETKGFKFSSCGTRINLYADIYTYDKNKNREDIMYGGNNYKIRTGPRGGRYILVRKKKIYIA